MPNSPFKILTIPKLSREFKKDPEFLIEGLIYRNTINLIVGRPKCGKSLIMLQLAHNISRGEKVFGKFQCSKARVLYVDQDNRLITIKKRFEMLENYKKNKNLFYLKDVFQIDDVIHFNFLEKEIKRLKIEVMILDCYVRIHNKEESSSFETAKVSKLFNQLTQMGVTVFAVHHSGKDYRNIVRGSSEIIGGADEVFWVRKNKEDKDLFFESRETTNLEREIKLKISIKKLKNGVVRLVSHKNERRDKKVNRGQCILQLFKPNPTRSLSVEDVKNQTRIGANNTRKSLKELVGSGKLRSYKKTKGKQFFILPS